MQLLWPITRDDDSSLNQSETEVIRCNRRQARENARVQPAVLLLIGWESGASFVNQSQSEAKPNQNKHEILLTLENRSNDIKQ